MKKRIIYLPLALLILILLVPTILSTRLGTSLISFYLPSKVKIESLSLSWFGPQSASNITLKDKDALATIPSLEVDATFAALLFSSFEQVRIENATASIEGKETFSDISATITKHSVNASGNSPNGKFNLSWDKGNLQGSATNFPVIAFDTLLSLVTNKYKNLLPDLFGMALSFSVNATINADKIEGDGAITSPLFTAAFSIATRDGVVTITKPISALWKMQNRALALILPDAHLNEPLPLEIDISSFAIPYEESKFDPSSLSIKAIVVANSGSIELGGPISIKKGSLSLKSSDLLHQADVSLNGTFSYNSMSDSAISLSGHLHDWYPLSQNSTVTNLSVKLTDFPIIDPSIAKYVGSALSATLLQENDLLTISVNSELISLPSSRFTLSDSITLEAPTTLTYTGVIPITLELAKLKVPLANWKQTSLDGRIVATQTTFLDNITLRDGQATIRAEKLNAIDIHGNANITIADQALDLSFYGKGDMHKNELSPLTLEVSGDIAKASLEGRINPTSFTLTKKALIALNLTPESINPLLQKYDFPLLGEKAPLTITIPKTTFPFESHSLNFDATIEGKRILLIKGTTPIPLEKVKGKIRIDESFNRASIELTSNTIDFSLASLEFDRTKLDSTPFALSLRLKEMQTEIVDVLLSRKTSLKPITGPTIDMSLYLSKEKEEKTLNVSLSSKYLDASGKFDIKDAVTLQDRHMLDLVWTTTPEGYSRLGKLLGQNNLSIPLVQNAKIKASFSKFSLPIKEQKPLFPSVDSNLFNALFAGEFQSDTLEFSTLAMKGLRAHISKAKGNGPLTFTLVSSISPGSGTINAKGRFEDLFTPSGTINLASLTSDLDILLKNVPTSSIDAISQLTISPNALPSNILGETTNVKIEAKLQNMNGPLQIDLDATNCKAILDGRIQDSVLELNRPLQLVCALTPQLSRFLLGDSQVEITSAKNPLMLYVDDTKFTVPLSDPKSGRIGHFRLDLGQLEVGNQGLSKKLAKFLRMQNAPSIPLWFAPCDGSLKQGRLYIERTEILLARRLRVALWGSIYPNREYVDMILGLPAPTMQAALGIRAPSSSYVLKVPLRGPYGGVELDVDSVKQRMTAMMAGKAIQGLVPQGSIWGGIAGAVTELADDQGDVPPAKRPFPWEAQTGMNKSAEFNKKRVHRKSKSNFKKLKKLLLKDSKG